MYKTRRNKKIAKRKLTNKLVTKKSIQEELRKIPHTKNAYATPSGKIYLDYENDMFLLLKLHNVYGYLYCGITMEGNTKPTSKRVHRLIAMTYIPNPNNFPIVGHKNNIKSDNRIENLYWTTNKENSQKSHDDGLSKNDKSWNDSQSIPVCQFDMNGNLIAIYGSVSEAARITKMTKTGILQQCKHVTHSKPRKGFYYRYLKEFNHQGFVL